MTITSDPVFIQSGAAQMRGTLICPANPSRTVIISGATGVAQGFYRKFATWLAETQDTACLTYDYRDFGASDMTGAKHSEILMSDWGIRDGQAAREWMKTRFPTLPLWVIGHSLGAVLVPFQDRLDQIDRLIAVSSGPAHVTHHPWPYQAVARSFWQGHGPLLVALFGYLPGRLSGFGADLPKGVYTQWRRWCLTKGFAQSDIGRTLPELNPKPYQGAFKLVTAADDVMIPAAQAHRMLALFPKAATAHLNLIPQENGLKKIGHLGAFSGRNKALWPQIIA